MIDQMKTCHGNLNRRELLVQLGALAAVPDVAATCECEVKPEAGTVRDRFWLFGYPPNSDYPSTKKLSVMSPAEGAYYICVPNVAMIQVYAEEDKYGILRYIPLTQFERPYDRYAVALRPFKRVLWSVVGDSGLTYPDEQRMVIELAKSTPNFTGVFMDDFFTYKENSTERSASGKVASLSTDELAQLQKQLKGPGKKLDLYVTLYTYQLAPSIVDYLNLIDVTTLWTWDSKDLLKLESNMDKLEGLAPKIRKILGIYTIDYPNQGGPVPIPRMKHQCDLGLKWLHEGRVEGLMFLGNGHYDIGYDSVEWLRGWIRDVGDTKL